MVRVVVMVVEVVMVQEEDREGEALRDQSLQQYITTQLQTPPTIRCPPLPSNRAPHLLLSPLPQDALVQTGK